MVNEDVINLKFWNSIYPLTPNRGRVSIYKDRQSDDIVVNNGLGNTINRDTEVGRDMDIGYRNENGIAPIYFEKDNQTLVFYISDEFDDILTNQTGQPIEIGGENRINLDSIDFRNYASERDECNITLVDRDTGHGLTFTLISVSNNDVEELESNQDRESTDKIFDMYNDDSGASNFDMIEQLANNFNKDPVVTQINSGGSRIAYKVTDTSKYGFLRNGDGCIVKLAKNSRAQKDNRKEFQTYNAVKQTNVSKYFCPITNSAKNHRAIVMEEADVEATGGSSGFGSKAKMIEEALAKKVEFNPNENISLDNDIEDETSEKQLKFQFDINSKNVGIYNGDPVLIDYPYGARVNILEDTNNSIADRLSGFGL